MGLDATLAKRVIRELDPPAKAGRTRQEQLEDAYAKELADRERQRRTEKRAARPKCPHCGQHMPEKATT
jgi:hypothetical protein